MVTCREDSKFCKNIRVKKCNNIKMIYIYRCDDISESESKKILKGCENIIRVKSRKI